MAILKTAGAALFIIGMLLGVYTIVTAKKTKLFDDLAELKRIRETGYTKEHHEEERREDIYRREPAAPQARLMSRRAKRVLERMNEAENAAKNEEQEEAKGKAVLEEVVPKGDEPDNPVKYESVEVAPENRTSGKLLRRARRTKQTASGRLPETAPPEIHKEGTDILIKDSPEGTDVLPAASAEGTDVLRRDTSEGTDILPSASPAKGPEEEGTAILTPSAEEATDILVRSDEEGTSVLTAAGEGTDILNTSEATDVLERR